MILERSPRTHAAQEPLYDSNARKAPIASTLGDLYLYRSLVRLLVARDLTVRYKRSLLGVTWTVLNPLLTSLVMWAVFNRLFHASVPGNAPYIVYLLAGMIAINYFQQGIMVTASSLATSAHMLTKVYVPPVVFAVAAACSGAVNFAFGLIPLLAFQLALGPGVSWMIVLLPLPLCFMLAMIAGIGLFISTFAIRFDDVLNLVNVLLLIVSYLTPTFYPVTIIPVAARKYLYINPVYSYVNVFRYLEYGGPHPTLFSLLIVFLTGTVGLSVGISVFARRWPTVAVLL